MWMRLLTTGMNIPIEIMLFNEADTAALPTVFSLQKGLYTHKPLLTLFLLFSCIALPLPLHVLPECTLQLFAQS